MSLLLRIVSKPENEMLVVEEKRFQEEGGSVGRAEHCELVLPDDTKHISKIHALIHFRDEAYYLTDVSTNGVFVNNDTVPIGKGNTKQILAGDKLRMGDYVLQASFPSAGAKQASIVTAGVRNAPEIVTDDLEDLLALNLENHDLLTTTPLPELQSSEIPYDQSIDDILDTLERPSEVLDLDNVPNDSFSDIEALLTPTTQTSSMVESLSHSEADRLFEKFMRYCSLEAFLSFTMGQNIDLLDVEKVYSRKNIENFFQYLRNNKAKILQ